MSSPYEVIERRLVAGLRLEHYRTQYGSGWSSEHSGEYVRIWKHHDQPLEVQLEGRFTAEQLRAFAVIAENFESFATTPKEMS